MTKYRNHAIGTQSKSKVYYLKSSTMLPWIVRVLLVPPLVLLCPYGLLVSHAADELGAERVRLDLTSVAVVQLALPPG